MLARYSLLEGHLCAGNKSAQNLIVGKFLQLFIVIGSDKLATDSLVLLVCWLSVIPPKRGKECLANCFQSKICKLMPGKLFKCLFTQVYAPYNFIWT